MLTLFACPKPFRDPHIALIQRNAIRSWTLLEPKPAVVLVGEEEGVAEIARELGVLHLPQVACNELGTPLLNDVFSRAEQAAPNQVFCYVNADVILMDDFMKSIAVAVAAKRRFMLGGRVWNLEITSPLEFQPGWSGELRKRVAQEGVLRNPSSCDFFAYTAGLWGDLPPFVVGRCGFDNALMGRARRNWGALIDATDSALGIHQAHDYPAHLGGAAYNSNREAEQNREMAGGRFWLLSWSSGTHVVRNGRLVRNLSGTFCLAHLWHLYFGWAWYPFLGWTRPIRHRFGLRVRG